MTPDRPPLNIRVTCIPSPAEVQVRCGACFRLVPVSQARRVTPPEAAPRYWRCERCEGDDGR